MERRPHKDSPEHLELIERTQPEMLRPSQREALERWRESNRTMILPILQQPESPDKKAA